ncbi:uncharacterized protein PRCAT00005612001 [Priceomyces carsonii]|uniref:uncharacterized protein n=1 Tax=Priceomyces carsonii TaxID=28549 RepID=UPI002ED910A0|nr:unnamed protein product [Priceomyces carsonii]
MIRICKPNIRSLNHLLLIILFSWLILFYVNERLLPKYAAKSCKWPKLEASSDTQKEFKNDQDQDKISEARATNVLFIADPQLIDNHTYPSRNQILLKLSEHTVDIHLKKNYNAFMSQLKPDYIFFLGDYLDNGRSSSRKYYKGQLKRFNRIFKKFKYKKNKNYFTNVAGNHDIGWADGVKIPSRKRFAKNFGKPNGIKLINNVDFITLDTISLSSSIEGIYRDARLFLDLNFGESIVKTNPRILLSHVPLFRDVEKYKCGPLRENPKFFTHGGYQYKLALEPDISTEIIRKVKPDLIFTGDDHDYCDITHEEVEDQRVREIAVKSISMAMGIRYPGVQILTFVNENNEDYNLGNNFRYETKLCYTQTPYYNIISYVILAVISSLMIWYWDIMQSANHGYTILPYVNGATEPSFASASQKEKTSNLKKISKFIKDQDDESYKYNTGFSKYTSSAPRGSWLTNVINRIKLRTRFKFPIIDKFKLKSSPIVCISLKKLNLGSFLKHSILMAIVVISVYYLGFCLTL